MILRKTFLIICIIFASTISGCSRPPLHQPPKGIFDSPCELPCWYGIVPGETTKPEINALVKNIPGLVLTDDNEWVTRDNSNKSWMYIPYDSGHTLTIQTSNNSVSFIDISGNWAGMGLKLKEIIQNYGEPECTIGIWASAGDVMFQDVVIRYPSKNLDILVNGGSEEDAYKLLPSSHVRSIMISSDSISEIIKYYRSTYGKDFTNQGILHMCDSWIDYGTYSESTIDQ